MVRRVSRRNYRSKRVKSRSLRSRRSLRRRKMQGGAMRGFVIDGTLYKCEYDSVLKHGTSPIVLTIKEPIEGNHSLAMLAQDLSGKGTWSTDRNTFTIKDHMWVQFLRSNL